VAALLPESDLLSGPWAMDFFGVESAAFLVNSSKFRGRAWST